MRRACLGAAAPWGGKHGRALRAPWRRGAGNTTTADHQSNPSITALADGGYVVTWTSNLQDGSNYGIYAQRYSADGSLVGGEFRVNTTTANHQNAPSIAALSGGGFVVTWTSVNQDGSSSGVYGQQYGANGVPIGGEFRVNTDYCKRAAGTDGRLACRWRFRGKLDVPKSGR